MTSVWIVTSGEKCEGGIIYGVFRDRPDDETVKGMVRACFGDWKETAEDGEWLSGYNWLSVDEHPIIDI